MRWAVQSRRNIRSHQSLSARVCWPVLCSYEQTRPQVLPVQGQPFRFSRIYPVHPVSRELFTPEVSQTHLNMEMKTDSHMNISPPLWKCRVSFDACQEERKTPVKVFTAVNDLYYASVIFTVIIIITSACAIHFTISPLGPPSAHPWHENKTRQWFNPSVFLYSQVDSRTYGIISVSTLVFLESVIMAADKFDRLESSLFRLLTICMTFWPRIAHLDLV